MPWAGVEGLWREWWSRLCDVPGGGQEEEWIYYDYWRCGCYYLQDW